MVKQSHDPGQDQIKPGGCIGKPGGKEGQHQIRRKLRIQKISQRITHFPEFHHKNIGNSSQNAGKKKYSDPSKIIIGIVEQRQGRQLGLVHINRKIDQLRKEKLQPRQRPQWKQPLKAKAVPRKRAYQEVEIIVVIRNIDIWLADEDRHRGVLHLKNPVQIFNVVTPCHRQNQIKRNHYHKKSEKPARMEQFLQGNVGKCCQQHCEHQLETGYAENRDRQGVWLS